MIGAVAARSAYGGGMNPDVHGQGVQLTPIRVPPHQHAQQQPQYSPGRAGHRRGANKGKGVSPVALHSQGNNDYLGVLPNIHNGAGSSNNTSDYDESAYRSTSSDQADTDNGFEPDPVLEMNWRQRVYQFFEEPRSSKGAFVFSLFFFVLILVSSLTLCLETLPEYHAESEADKGPWFTIEAVCVAFFTIEFVARLSTTPSYVKFMKNPMNFADALSIFPFYFELVFSSDSKVDLRNIRMIRLARVFRVFKLSRYSVGLQVTGRAMIMSAEALTMLVFFTAIALMIFASAMYYAERGSWHSGRQEWIREDNRRSPYQSIPDSFWWCITTLTTVGYGDDVPLGEYGKLIAGLTMMAGILIIALPTSVIGANFMQEWRKHELNAAKTAKQKEVKDNLGRELTKEEKIKRLTQDHDRLVGALQMISEHVRETQHIYTVSTSAFKENSKAANYSQGLSDPNGKIRGPPDLQQDMTMSPGHEGGSLQDIRARLVRAEMRVMELEAENSRLRGLE